MKGRAVAISEAAARAYISRLDMGVATNFQALSTYVLACNCTCVYFDLQVHTNRLVKCEIYSLLRPIYVCIKSIRF